MNKKRLFIALLPPDSAPDLTGQLVVRTIVESHPRIAVDLVTSLVLSEAADSEAEDSKAEDSKTEDSEAEDSD